MCCDFQEMGLAAKEYPAVCRQLASTKAELKATQENAKVVHEQDGSLRRQIRTLQQLVKSRDVTVEVLESQVTLASTRADTLHATCEELKEQKAKWHSRHGHLNRKITNLEAKIRELGADDSPPTTASRRGVSRSRSVPPGSPNLRGIEGKIQAATRRVRWH